MKSDLLGQKPDNSHFYYQFDGGGDYIVPKKAGEIITDAVPHTITPGLEIVPGKIVDDGSLNSKGGRYDERPF